MDHLFRSVAGVERSENPGGLPLASLLQVKQVVDSGVFAALDPGHTSFENLFPPCCLAFCRVVVFIQSGRLRVNRRAFGLQKGQRVR